MGKKNQEKTNQSQKFCVRFYQEIDEELGKKSAIAERMIEGDNCAIRMALDIFYKEYILLFK